MLLESHHPTPNLAGSTTLAILAGGQGLRMGMPKGQLRINGTPILKLLADRLAWPGPTMLVTAPGVENPFGIEHFGLHAIDPIAGQGPLRGVLTALEHSTTELLIVVPVDMPCLTSEPLVLLAAALEEQSGKAVAMFRRQDASHTWIEPLPAAFAVSAAAPLVRGHLEQGQKALRDLANNPSAILLQSLPAWPENLWLNLNRPEDLQAYMDVRTLLEAPVSQESAAQAPDGHRRPD